MCFFNMILDESAPPLPTTQTTFRMPALIGLKMGISMFYVCIYLKWKSLRSQATTTLLQDLLLNPLSVLQEQHK